MREIILHDRVNTARDADAIPTSVVARVELDRISVASESDPCRICS